MTDYSLALNLTSSINNIYFLTFNTHFCFMHKPSASLLHPHAQSWLDFVDHQIEQVTKLLPKIPAYTTGGRLHGQGVLPINFERHQFLKAWHDRVMEQYVGGILPLRQRQGLGTIGGHGTDVSCLFGKATRKFGIGEKGILFDGLRVGDFGAFESTNAGGQGGWWGGVANKFPNPSSGKCWILRGQESSRDLVVLPDPATHLYCLEKLRERLLAGDVISEKISSIIHLGGLFPILMAYNGRLP